MVRKAMIMELSAIAVTVRANNCPICTRLSNNVKLISNYRLERKLRITVFYEAGIPASEMAYK